MYADPGGPISGTNDEQPGSSQRQTDCTFRNRQMRK